MCSGNEKGLTLLEVLVSLTLFSFLLIAGFGYITHFMLDIEENTEEMAGNMQVSGYTTLFLDDIRYAEMVALETTDGVIALRYRAGDQDKEMVYQPTEDSPNQYTVSYQDNYSKTSEWLNVEVADKTRPVLELNEHSLTINKKIGGVEQVYTLYLRGLSNE